MLKHKCPKCGNELGYKWNTSLYTRGYQCSKCKTKLQTTYYLQLAMFLTFLTGLTITDYVAPKVSYYATHPQLTKSIFTFIFIIAVWMVVSLIMPRMIKIKDQKK